RIRIPWLGFSTADTSVLSICGRVTNPRRRALSRVEGMRSMIPVHREQSVRPAMSRTEHIPGTQNACVESAVPDDLLTLFTHGDVGFHHRRRMGHADVHKMFDLR